MRGGGPGEWGIDERGVLLFLLSFWERAHRLTKLGFEMWVGKKLCSGGGVEAGGGGAVWGGGMS